MSRVLEEIESDNEWRYGEFARFKTNSGTIEEVTWCRMCTPMIYAHWEGFVVSAMKILIDHLNSKKLTPQDVTTKFMVVSLGESYKRLSGKQSFSQRIEFTDIFKGLYIDPIKIKSKINTKSNLNSDVLEALCEMFDFDFNKFSPYTRNINQLVNIRNCIAHGENSFQPDINKISEFINTVTRSNDILLEEIAVFLDKKPYLITDAA